MTRRELRAGREALRDPWQKAHGEYGFWRIAMRLILLALAVSDHQCALISSGAGS
jgi:hypothetical protein